MHEDHILKTLEAAQRPLSIAEVKEAIAENLRNKVSYETTKKDLITLSAKGLIHSKCIGKGKRVTWIFWALKKEDQPKAQAPAKRVEPFKVSIAERDLMTTKELTALYDRLVGEHGRLVGDHLGRGSRYIVLCDGKVVHRSNHEPSDEEIRNLERNLGKVCYALTEDPIEESRWSPIRNGDYHPTIEVFIGSSQWKEEEAFHRGPQITPDSDTGNPDIAAFSDEDLNLIQPIRTHVMRRAFHFGKHYDYHLATLKICIKDAKSATRCIQKTCRSVLSWTEPERNPFLLANPTRKGFVGRDLMLTFPLNIQLSGKNKQSKVLIE